jgi:hypothetical protein
MLNSMIFELNLLIQVPRMDGMCPALNCTSGQYQFAPCHGYRYYMCKASLDPGIQIDKDDLSEKYSQTFIGW